MGKKEGREKEKESENNRSGFNIQCKKITEYVLA
jgi:hypothetical protein